MEEEERGTASPVPANDVFTHERTSSRSLKKKIAKAVRGTSKRFRRRSYETGSLSGQLSFQFYSTASPRPTYLHLIHILVTAIASKETNAWNLFVYHFVL